MPQRIGQMMAAWSPAETPSRACPSVSFASSAMTLTSARPAPTAVPLIAEMIGLSQASML
ncbi:Uncharacterised protein [Bordetella pertussis]|nr:Uncharacterised protein [Bordetella pertussis]